LGLASVVIRDVPLFFVDEAKSKTMREERQVESRSHGQKLTKTGLDFLDGSLPALPVRVVTFGILCDDD
jgi:hypothetical protein